MTDSATGAATTSTHTLTAQPEPAGIGGWLILVAIGQILGPLRTLLETVIYYTDKDVRIAFEKFPIATYGESLINLAYLAVVLFTTYAFFAHKRIFKLMFTVEILCLIFVPPLDVFWMSAATGLPVSALADPALGKSIGAGIIGLIWVAYVWRSKRVRNTFVF